MRHERFDDMSKGEEIFNAAMSTTVREGYPVLTEEHPFLKNLSRFMSDKTHWLGTASDLMYEMNDHSTPANTVTKLLRRFELELYHRSRIEVVFRRTNRKRIIELFKFQ